MSEPSASSSSRGARGSKRGSRGGLGKYLRARGRGRGAGRPAVFTERLLLEGESDLNDGELDEQALEAAAEHARKFSRRELGTNADRYKEPAPELNSDGEVEVEPEVDLSTFLERQRLSDGAAAMQLPADNKNAAVDDDDDDVDHTLDHISLHRPSGMPVMKGKVQKMDWDEGLDEMIREKAAAEATWDLKSRFRAKSHKLRTAADVPRSRTKAEKAYVEAPALPTDAPQSDKPPKAEMEDFLDDLLS